MLINHPEIPPSGAGEPPAARPPQRSLTRSSMPQALACDEDLSRRKESNGSYRPSSPAKDHEPCRSCDEPLKSEGVRGLRNESHGPSGREKLLDRMLVGFVGGGGKWLVE